VVLDIVGERAEPFDSHSVRRGEAAMLGYDDAHRLAVSSFEATDTVRPQSVFASQGSGFGEENRSPSLLLSVERTGVVDVHTLEDAAELTSPQQTLDIAVRATGQDHLAPRDDPALTPQQPPEFPLIHPSRKPVRAQALQRSVWRLWI
jgi:hypothetical protein